MSLQKAMKNQVKLGVLFVLAALCAAVFGAPSASAEFGIEKWDGSVRAQDGTPYTQAGGHPFDSSTTIEVNQYSLEGVPHPEEPTKDVLSELPAGLIGNTTPYPQCEPGKLLLGEPDADPVFGRPYSYTDPAKLCPIGAIVGTAHVHVFGATLSSPMFVMTPPHGGVVRFGFNILSVLVSVDGTVREDGELHVGVDGRNISEALPLTGTRLVFWGMPYDKAHDPDRCWSLAEFYTGNPEGPSSPLCHESTGTGAPHSIANKVVPLLRMPTRCTQAGEGLRYDVAVDSWRHVGVFDTASFFTHEPEPNQATQKGTENCDVVPSNPQMTVTPTAKSAETASGLDVELKVPSDGLLNPDGVSQSDLKKVEVTLPEGVSINPSQADGLGVCTQAQYAAETPQGEPGSGCPSTAKIGTVQIDTPVLRNPVPGNLYVAAPYDNPFNSLLALYIVAKDPETGVQIKSAGEVKPDPKTGQITTVFDNLPQAPFETFNLHFREGQHSPLSTPATCGSFETVARFTPWARPDEVLTRTSTFEVNQGVHGGACPTGATPPFHPGLQAGTINNRAGSYSPFNVRLTREDGEQEMTNFSIKLPPGVIGKLAGLGYCSDAAIEAARHKTGAQELASPSCPANSQIGRTLAGAGVGSALVYSPGKIYYAGPYHGHPISIAAITAAKVGPFDLGTVVVRFALDVNPETAEIFIDSTGSDPIPHILAGIPLHVRDIRAYNDRPEFTLNPTSCERMSTASTVLGSGLDFASAFDDKPVTVSTPFQAADCAALPFKPDLRLFLRGGTKRAGHPKLKAVLKMPAGNANVASAQVTLPKSEFLDQSHIGTVCTRVQFKQGSVPGGQCPAASVYGYAKGISPILSTPIEGPVFLRSSEHKLPDLVAALHSQQIDINVIGRIDSVDGRLRTTFESVPDAPVSSFVLTMQGGKKGLLENSTNLCRSTNKAIAKFDGHNGKARDFNPVLKPQCGKAAKKGKGSKPKGAQPSPAPSPYRAR